MKVDQNETPPMEKNDLKKLSSENRFIRDVGITLPLLFSVIMLSDSYLLGHFTGLLFVFFSSFLYKDFDKS